MPSRSGRDRYRVWATMYRRLSVIPTLKSLLHCLSHAQVPLSKNLALLTRKGRSNSLLFKTLRLRQGSYVKIELLIRIAAVGNVADFLAYRRAPSALRRVMKFVDGPQKQSCASVRKWMHSSGANLSRSWLRGSACKLRVEAYLGARRLTTATTLEKACFRIPEIP